MDKNLPEIATFFLETPLYEKFKVSPESEALVYEMVTFMEKIDCYCPACEKQSTFKGLQTRTLTFTQAKNNNNTNILYKWRSNFTPVNLACTRDESHRMQIVFKADEDSIWKIGQFPSIADLSLPDLKKYRDVLSGEKYKELVRGIGLTTHSVGIGAFVYFRRIFENLIEEAHQISAKQPNWNEAEYNRSRMDEKILLLQMNLPEFLVNNRKLYGILSKGIHELSEEECLEFFPAVRLAIELILDEKLEARKRIDKIKHAEKSLGMIHETIISANNTTS